MRISIGRPQRSPRIRVFIEFFCGCASLSRAVAGLGGFILVWDLALGGKYDLTIKCNQQLIFGWIREGVASGTHLGTDCASWSRARDNGRNGFPGPLRSNTCVLGLPNLSDKDQLKVTLGNLLMKFSFAVVALCDRMMVPCTMENPSRSRIWLTANYLHIEGLKSFSKVVTHYCRFGSPWRKETRIIGVHISLLDLELKCSGRRVCSETGKPHVKLCGLCPQTGRWRTAFGNEYPARLGRLWARAFALAEATICSRRMSKLVG